MKLKRKISKDDYEKLSDEIKGLYTQSGDDYVLDLDDTAFESLKAEKKKAEEELKKYQDEEAERIKKAEERAEQKAKEKYEKAKTDKDVEAIEKSWTEKYDTLTKKHADLESKHADYVRKNLIENAVAKMASEISSNPLLISPHIRSRLDVDFTGDEPKLIVLDTNGQRSAHTLAELKQSFIDNKDFSAIIKATTANGGAKAGGSSGGATGDKQQRLGEMSDHELAQLAKAKYGNQQE